VSTTQAAEAVTVDNFVRAETDMTMKHYVSQGAFGKFLHLRGMTPVDRQDVIRMNRDTLYSAGVFDLTAPVTIVKPDPGKRFQSMMMISEDHSILPVEHGAGEFTLTRQQIGTRYVMVLFRTFADPNEPADLKAAHALQDRIQVRQADAGTFDVPQWSTDSSRKVRDALNVLAATKTDMSGMFGEKSKLDPIDRLLGAASGWGGNPKEAAVYQGGMPKLNDGKTPYVLTVRDVPVDGFWSVTVYNAKGYMEPNPQNAYSVNNVTAKRDADGSVTIRFGGDPGSTNYLPIVPGWSYVARMYQPRQPVVDGTWKFPEAQPAKWASIRAKTVRALSDQAAEVRGLAREPIDHCRRAVNKARGVMNTSKQAAEPEVLRDGDGAKLTRCENMHKTRFLEIFLAGHEAKTGKTVAACYNTMYTTKGSPASKDTAPQAWVEGLSMEKLKSQYGVLGASLSGPKIWMPDWLDVAVGKERDFNGAKFSWVAQLEISEKGGIGEDRPYVPMKIARDSKLGWKKGTQVALLDDPEGNVWILKGFQLGLKPKQTFEQFMAAGQGQFKKLPPGWKFRVKTLDQDVIESPEGGVATIMPDEFFNIYDKTGPGMTNYKP
jgi:hypothetical protein